jgi:MFS family permease
MLAMDLSGQRNSKPIPPMPTFPLHSPFEAAPPCSFHRPCCLDVDTRSSVPAEPRLAAGPTCTCCTRCWTILVVFSQWLQALRLGELGAEFYLVVTINALFLLTYHSFWNFAAHLFVAEGVSVDWAGVIISLPSLAVVLLAPAVGAAMDRAGAYSLHVCLVAGLASVVAFALLLHASSLSARAPGSLLLYVLPSVLLAVAGAVMPATTMATIPSILAKQAARLPLTAGTGVGEPSQPHLRRSGVAFGLLEIILQASHVAGNLFFGYLYDAHSNRGYQDSIICMLVITSLTTVVTAAVCYHRKHSTVSDI